MIGVPENDTQCSETPLLLDYTSKMYHVSINVTDSLECDVCLFRYEIVACGIHRQLNCHQPLTYGKVVYNVRG